MYLTNTTETLQVILSGSVATSQSVVTVDYGENTATTFVAGHQRASTNNTTAVDILAAPAASTQRIVQFLTMTNADSAAITVTIRKNNGGTLSPQFGPVTLQPAERIEFATDTGFSVFNAAGAQKVTAAASTVAPGYIDGGIMVRSAAQQLQILPGTAYIPSIGQNVNFPSTLTKSTAGFTSSTFYHVYWFLNGATPDAEIVTTAPSSPYSGTSGARTKSGDATRRYVGSIYIDGSGNIANFTHNNNAIRYVDYTQTTPYRVLSSGTATTSTTVSAGGIVPVTAQSVMANVLNTDSTVFSQVNFVSGGIQQFFGRTGNVISFAWFALNSSQQFAYNLGGVSTGGALFIDILGYTYER